MKFLILTIFYSLIFCFNGGHFISDKTEASKNILEWIYDFIDKGLKIISDSIYYVISELEVYYKIRRSASIAIFLIALFVSIYLLHEFLSLFKSPKVYITNS